MPSAKLPIYLVDDDKSVRRSLHRLFLSIGYELETFDSASSFLDSVPSDTQGILIVDVLMPKMGGFELQQRLNELRSPLKLIFITAHAQSGDRERAMSNGAHGFLQKPFNDESLIDAIEMARHPLRPLMGPKSHSHEN